MNRTNVPSPGGSGATEGATTTKIDATITAWTPTKPGTDPDSVEVLFARAAVAAAGPRSTAEAAQALRWCHQFAVWCTANGRTVDAADAFAAGDIEEFLDEEYAASARGTRDAVRSHLRRLAPGVGLAGTTRTPAAHPQPTTAAGERGDDMVNAAISGYVPDRIDAARWDAISGVVRDSVRTAQPATPGRAIDLLRHAGYLAAWAHHQEHPVRTDTIFAADTIEAFIAAIEPGWVTSSVRTAAANLHHIREALDLPLDCPRRTFASDAPKDPYTPGDIDGFYARANLIPTRSRKRFVTAALDLIFGAGITGAAAGHVRPCDLTVIDDHLHLNYAAPGADPDDRCERLRILDGHTASLEALRQAAIDQGDEYMLGGHTARRDRRCSGVLKAEDVRFGLRIDMTRARLTWAYEAGQVVCDHVGGIHALQALLRNPTIVDLLGKDRL